MAFFQATPEQMVSTANKCHQRNAAIVSRKTQTMNTIESLNGTSLSGAMNVALQSVSAQIDAGMRKIDAAQTAMADIIIGGAGTFRETDEAAAAQLRSAGGDVAGPGTAKPTGHVEAALKH